MTDSSMGYSNHLRMKLANNRSQNDPCGQPGHSHAIRYCPNFGFIPGVRRGDPFFTQRQQLARAIEAQRAAEAAPEQEAVPLARSGAAEGEPPAAPPGTQPVGEAPSGST